MDDADLQYHSLASPSCSIPVINARLDLVSRLLGDAKLKEDIVIRLQRSADCQRLVQRFSMGRGDADDLLSLLKTIETTVSIAELLDKASRSGLLASESLVVVDPLNTLSQRFSLAGPRSLASQISSAIDEEGLAQSHQKEENESAKYVAAAQDILQSEGSSVDLDDMSSIARAKVTRVDSNEQETEDEDVWTMRRSSVRHSAVQFLPEYVLIPM